MPGSGVECLRGGKCRRAACAVVALYGEAVGCRDPGGRDARRIPPDDPAVSELDPDLRREPQVQAPRLQHHANHRQRAGGGCLQLVAGRHCRRQAADGDARSRSHWGRPTHRARDGRETGSDCGPDRSLRCRLLFRDHCHRRHAQAAHPGGDAVPGVVPPSGSRVDHAGSAAGRIVRGAVEIEMRRRTSRRCR